MVLKAHQILQTLSREKETLRTMGVVKLGLFGSYARGEQQPGSDLDFLVILRDNTFDQYMEVKFYLEDMFGLSVDLGIEDTLRPEIRERILREVIYVPELSTVSQ